MTDAFLRISLIANIPHHIIDADLLAQNGFSVNLKDKGLVRQLVNQTLARYFQRMKLFGLPVREGHLLDGHDNPFLHRRQPRHQCLVGGAREPFL